MPEISGYIERITFQNDLNGFTVARLKEPEKTELTFIVGIMPSVNVGVTIRCEGEWKIHPVHGLQFDVQEYGVEVPHDVVGIEKYLASGLVRGIGPEYAKRIVRFFQEKTLKIIDESPDRLMDVPGIGKKRLAQIKSRWLEHSVIRELMIFLQTIGLSVTFAQKIYKRYGAQSVAVIKENPYRLAGDIWGIGFKTVDRIAKNMGIANDSVERISAGIEYSLSELMLAGHVCYPLYDFFVSASELLNVVREKVEEQVKKMEYDDKVVIRKLDDSLEYIWLKSMALAEEGIVRELERLAQNQTLLRPVKIENALEWVQKELGITLAENQVKAVKGAIAEKVFIITGGPGTGKSTITHSILTIMAHVSERLFLVAPTGRAAKRMTEITGRPASTIHSLLEYNFKLGDFKYNQNHHLSCDLLIVDEASMIDTNLMHDLLKAVPDHAKVIFVGDIHQLPSIGPGNVLRDFIRSKKIRTEFLTEIYRQAAGSRIILNAHKINNGIYPDIQNTKESDFFFLAEDDPEKVMETVVSVVCERLPKKYKFDPVAEIQVLTPQHRGVIGTQNLNQMLQKSLNKNTNEGINRDGIEYRAGDKVMQIRNNYIKTVFNGDLGIIEAIDPVDQIITVKMQEKYVEYEFSELDELMLAYAVTIHKFQGSEYPCVVIPLHTTHFKMLHRNLLYTGVTRGKKLVVIVGNKKALMIAVRNDEVRKRYTGLVSLLARD